MIDADDTGPFVLIPISAGFMYTLIKSGGPIP